MINLTKRQKDILIGTVLGDAYLQKTGQKNARLRLEHGGKQKEYIMWKAKELGNLIQGKPKPLKRVHPITKKTYSYWYCIRRCLSSKDRSKECETKVRTWWETKRIYNVEG